LQAHTGIPLSVSDAFICPQCRAEPAGEFIALALKEITMRRWLPSLAFALIFAAPAAAADLPARKPGLWELKMAFEGGNLPFIDNPARSIPMFKRLLVPVDGSPTSDSGLKTAIRMAKDERATLILVHVVDENVLVMSGESLTFGETDFDPGSQWYRNLSVVGGNQRLLEPVVKWAQQAPAYRVPRPRSGG
jgi:hypothetical protein